MATDLGISNDPYLLPSREVDGVSQGLEGWFSGLARTEVSDWGTRLGTLYEVARGVPDDRRAWFSKRLVDGVFISTLERSRYLNWVFTGGDMPEDASESVKALWVFTKVNARKDFVDFFHETMGIAAALDQQTAQGTVLDNYIGGGAGGKQLLVDLAFGFPEFRADDMLVDRDKMEVKYLGRIIKIHPPLLRAYKARELMSGQALLIEDEEGEPISILYPNTYNVSSGSSTVGDACTASEYVSKHYYGEPVSLEEIKETLDDEEFNLKLMAVMGGGDANNNCLPVGGRVRFRKLVSDEATSVDAWGLASMYKQDFIDYLQMLDDQEAPKAVNMIYYLMDNVDQERAFEMMQGVSFVGRYASGMVNEDLSRSNKYTRLIEQKLKLHLQEAMHLFENHRNDMDGEDWSIVSSSLIALYRASRIAVSMAGETKEELDDFERGKPPDYINVLLDFYGKFPDARVTFQDYFDLVVGAQLTIQEEAGYVGGAEKEKADFYIAYDEMHERAATTDTPTDLARGESVILDLMRKKILPENPNVIFVGCNNCQRFEGPLMQRLRYSGVVFSKAYGVDLVDYSGQIPKDVEIIFKQGSILSDDFKPEEQADLIEFPWSVVNDIAVRKENLIRLLQRSKRFLKPGGIFVADVPSPIGEHSYESTVNEQAAEYAVYGMMKKGFATNTGELRSLFNIFPVEEMIIHAALAGFVPINVPIESDKRAETYSRIRSDDSFLHDNHKSKADDDAVNYPFWQTEAGQNRATLAFRYVGTTEALRLFGFTASILIARGFTTKGELED